MRQIEIDTSVLATPAHIHVRIVYFYLLFIILSKSQTHILAFQLIPTLPISDMLKTAGYRSAHSSRTDTKTKCDFRKLDVHSAAEVINDYTYSYFHQKTHCPIESPVLMKTMTEIFQTPGRKSRE